VLDCHETYAIPLLPAKVELRRIHSPNAAVPAGRPASRMREPGRGVHRAGGWRREGRVIPSPVERFVESPLILSFSARGEGTPELPASDILGFSLPSASPRGFGSEKKAGREARSAPMPE
jgi:hypothetical protein